MAQYQVNASANDGRQVGSNSGDIDITGAIVRIAGPTHFALVRFTGVSTDTNRKVRSASIELYVRDYTTGKFDILFESSSSPAAITAVANNISSRTMTSAKVSVDETMTSNTWWVSDDLKVPFQEVLDARGAVSTVAVILDCLSSGDFGFRSFDHGSSLQAKLNFVLTDISASFTGSPLSGLHESGTNSVSFTNSSSTDDPGGFTGGSSSWLWEYKKDSGSWTAFGSGAFAPTLSGLTAGTYSIRLTATSNDGTDDTFTRNNYFVVGSTRTATAAFTANKVAATPGAAVDFSDMSTTDDPGGIVGWQYERKLTASSVWSTFSGSQNPSGITWSSGTWDVRLTVTTDLGATDTHTENSYIVITASQISVFRPYGAPGAPLVLEAKPEARPLIPIATSSGVAIQMLIADFAGRVLTDFQPHINSVAWIENNVSVCKIRIARTDPKLQEIYIRDNNKVYFRFDNGLPDWGGVIRGPVNWTPYWGELTVYSGEHILFQRRCPQYIRFRGARVGAMLTQLVDYVAGIDPAGWVKLGKVWGGGGEHSPTYRWDKSVGHAIRDSLVKNLSAGGWDVTPKLVEGRSGTRIEFFVNLYERLGSDLVNVALQEGANIAPTSSKTSNDTVNVWYMEGEGEGDDDPLRPTTIQINQTSMGKHGRIEDYEQRNGVKVQYEPHH